MNKEELRQKMIALNTPTTELTPPFWEYWRKELSDRVVNGEDPDSFYTWPVIRHTMLIDHWPGAARLEYERLKEDKSRDWLSYAEMPSMCSTNDYLEGTTLSMNFLHQLYHLYLYEKHSGERIDQLQSIFEFGGGYGAMAFMAYGMGFRGHYCIYDLPEFALLQQYYLGQVVPMYSDWPACIWLDAITNIPISQFDLMIGCYSLSEIGYDFRRNLLTCYPADSYLLLYSGGFADYDNLEYFANFRRDSRPRVHWSHFHADQLPDHSEYSIGWTVKR